MFCFPFLMFLPMRVKNPPDRFPYVTLILIGINLLVYVFTISWTPGPGFLAVTPEALAHLAVSHENMNPIRVITAMFLHGGWEHIVGNMWFLWLFGPSVEGRLRPLKFISLYLLSGIVGFLLQDVMQGFLDPTQSGLGASGAIMGLCGAYLYVFPYSPFKVGWFSWLLFSITPRMGMWEWRAMWVVIFYLVINAFEAFASQIQAAMGHSGGVANLAHLGGMGTGYLFCVIAKTRRDSIEVSDAQAIRADVKDYDVMDVYELEALLQHPAEDMRLVVAFCEKTLVAPGGLGDQRCLWAIQTYARPLAETADKQRLAGIILRMNLDFVRMVPSIFMLRLGSNLEQIRDFEMAVRMYRRIWEVDPQQADTEVALSRLGRLMEQVYRNSEHARFYYSEQLRHHPAGRLAEDAKRSLAALPFTDTQYR